MSALGGRRSFLISCPPSPPPPRNTQLCPGPCPEPPAGFVLGFNPFCPLTARVLRPDSHQDARVAGRGLPWFRSGPGRGLTWSLADSGARSPGSRSHSGTGSPGTGRGFASPARAAGAALEAALSCCSPECGAERSAGSSSQVTRVPRKGRPLGIGRLRPRGLCGPSDPSRPVPSVHRPRCTRRSRLLSLG